MPKVCTVCTSTYREEIDIEIINGTSIIRDIAARFSLSRSSVGRHRVNCHKAIIASTLQNSKAAELLEAVKVAEGTEVGVTSLTRADEMYRRCRKATIEAFKRGDPKTAFQGAKEARGYLELLARLRGEGPEATQQPPVPLFQLSNGARISVVVGQHQAKPAICAGEVIETTAKEAEESEGNQEQ